MRASEGQVGVGGRVGWDGGCLAEWRDVVDGVG